MIAADLFMGRITGMTNKGLLIGYVVIVLGLGYRIIGLGMTDYFVALGFTVVIYLTLHFYKQLSYFQILKPLSDCSYTLYVVHMPILIFMSGWLQQKLAGTLPMHFGYAFLGIGVCLLFAWVAHFLVEKPFVKKKN